MTMQEISTAVQYRLPIKIFILNNQYMGMVRQWQELLHGGLFEVALLGDEAVQPGQQSINIAERSCDHALFLQPRKRN